MKISDYKLYIQKIYPIVTIIFIATIFIFIADKIDYTSPDYSETDLAKYRAMAESSPSLNFDIPKPFVYRIFAPWLAGILPLNLDLSFFLLNSIFLILLAITSYYFLLYHKVEKKIALFVTICFILNRYFFAFLAFDYFQFGDTLSYFLHLISFFLFTKKRWVLFSITLIIGILTREVALLIIPVGYLFLYEKKILLKNYLKYSVAILPSILVFIFFRVLVKIEGDENYLTQIISGFELFEPESIVKKFFISVTPFAFLSIVYSKELYTFFLKHLYLLILFIGTVFSSFFGFDHERLMSPTAPVFFLFLAIILEQTVQSKKWKSHKGKIFGTIITLAFLSTFYHLWGIIKLPNREITLIVTVILNLFMLIIFLILKHSTLTKN
ncbi:MAG: hypothetical protein GY932_10250 [Arcobacter sp.]|nr:hypothetical protein [Arcobacter sp.]